MRTIYLSSPTDLATATDYGIRASIRAGLQRRGCAVYDPAAAWFGAHESSARAQALTNAAALEACDGLIAIVGHGVSLAPIADAQYAVDLELPVLIVTPPRCPLDLHRFPKRCFNDAGGRKYAVCWAADLPARVGKMRPLCERVRGLEDRLSQLAGIVARGFETIQEASA